jgi:hypothetical protein
MDFSRGSETVVFVELVRQLVKRCTPWNMHILFGIIYTAGELPLAQLGHFFLMPNRLLCNGTEQKSPEARPGLGLAPSHFTGSILSCV